jgi:hypothetical protein
VHSVTLLPLAAVVPRRRAARRRRVLARRHCHAGHQS